MKNQKKTNKYEKEEIRINKIIREAFKQAVKFDKIDIKYSQKFAKFV